MYGLTINEIEYLKKCNPKIKTAIEIKDFNEFQDALNLYITDEICIYYDENNERCYTKEGKYIKSIYDKIDKRDDNKRYRLKRYIQWIDKFLMSKSTNKDSEFFDELEIYSTENDIMLTDDKDLIKLINNDIVEICIWVSTGQDCTKEREQLKKLYSKLVDMSNISELIEFKKARNIYDEYKKYVGKSIIVTRKDGGIWQCECNAFTSHLNDENGDAIDVRRSDGGYDIIYFDEIADIKIIG